MDGTRMTAEEAGQIAANVKRGFNHAYKLAQSARSLPDISNSMMGLTGSTGQILDVLMVFIREQERRNEELTAQVALLGQRVLALEGKQ